VIGGAAGRYEYFAYIADLFPAHIDLVQNYTGSLGVDATAEVVEAALFGLGRLPFDLENLFIHRPVVLVEHPYTVGSDVGDLAILQYIGFTGMAKQGGYVRGNEILPDSQSHHQRAVLAGRHQASGLIQGEYHHGVRSL